MTIQIRDERPRNKMLYQCLQQKVNLFPGVNLVSGKTVLTNFFLVLVVIRFHI